MPDYEQIKKLGSGNFGEVWLVYDHALGVKRAVKYIKPQSIHDPTEFYREPRTLMKLKHKNIVQVEDAGTMSNGNLYIAMTYIRKGSIEDVYKSGPILLLKARQLICDACWGLQYAHQNGYIHRDIKPSNILIDKQSRGLLSDFGLAVPLPRGGAASPYGYTTHLAPEIFRGGKTSFLSDMYALGVTAYRIFNGDAFLENLCTEEELIDLVLEGRYPNRKHYRPYIPRQLRTVVNRAMHLEPAKRYKSVAVFRRALESVNIRCNWAWTPGRNHITYQAKIDTLRIKVVVIQRSDRKFDIVTTKRIKDNERCVRKDTSSDHTTASMKSTLHNILSRYVTEGC